VRSHFVLLVTFAFFVSLVFGLLSKDDVREQLRSGATLFAGLVAVALIVSWLMFPFPL
jgi:undecaprenyl pyrophosphate phosphatase UppP